MIYNEEKALELDKLVIHYKSDSASFKSYINSYPKDKKGKFFEELIAELYRGNGWLAEVVGGRNDGGADVLLYHPAEPSVVVFIIQVKNHAQPLNYDDTKIELIKFEDKGKKKYPNADYKLITVNGFVKSAAALEHFKLALHDWKHIEELLSSYGKHETPHLELLSHNKLAVQKTESIFSDNKRLSVVHATGTGKRFIIGRLLLSRLDKNCLFLSPTNYINQQQEALLPYLQNVTYMTYQRVQFMSSRDISELNFDFIILDEFHRLGASKWGKSTGELLEKNSHSEVFATTATHIRYLDGERNMVDEICNGIISSHLTLEDAIARKILPPPKYVSCLYEMKESVCSGIVNLAT